MNRTSSEQRLDYEPFINLAHVTGDGVVSAVSDRLQAHPAYGTDSYEMEVQLPLTDHEAELYHELTTRNTGDVRCHVRSAIAQMGNTAFHPDSLEHVVAGNTLMIRTLLTNLNGERGSRTLETIRNLAVQGYEPRFMHMGLLPHHARLSGREELRTAQERGAVAVAPDADFYEDGSVGLPHQTVYGFDDVAFTPVEITRIVMGEGRANLAGNRYPLERFPEVFTKGQFLVTGADLRSIDYHVVLRPSLVADGQQIPAFQLESPVLHAGRTNKGLRQFEVYSPEDYAVQLSDTRVVADFYKASVIREPGH